MPTPRAPQAADDTPRVGGPGLTSSWLALGWLLLFTALFFTSRLANNPDQDRLSLLLLAPERLAAPFFPAAEQARVLAFGNLADRSDLLLVGGLLWFAAWGWGRCLLSLTGIRHETLTGGERHWLAAGLGLVLISLATLLIGLAGGLQPAVFRTAAVLGGLTGLVTCGRRRDTYVGPVPTAASITEPRVDRPGTRGTTRAALQANTPAGPLARLSTHSASGSADGHSRLEPSASQKSAVGWWWWLAILPFVGVQLLGALLPSSDFDVNEYHFGGPKEWFQAGRIHWLPHNVYTSFPFATEMVTLAGMVLHGDWYRGAVAGKTALCGLGLHTAAGLFFAGRRWFGAPAGAWAALLWLSQPWTYRIGTIAYAEGGLCAALAAGLWVLSLRSAPTGDRGTAAATPGDRPPALDSGGEAGPWWALGLCAGCGLACKYPGLISAVIPFAVACGWSVWWDGRRLPASLRRKESPAQGGLTAGTWTTLTRALAMYGAGVAVVAGPWLLKNLWETGNPVYPLGWTLLGGADWDADLNRRWRAAHSSSDYSPASMINLGVDILWRNDWVSPAVGALAPVALLGSTGRSVVRRLTVYLLWLFVSVWALTHRLDRFWVPLLPVAALLAGRGAMALFATWGRPGVPLARLSRPSQLARCGLTLFAGLLWLYCLVLIVSPLGGNNAYLMKFADAAQSVARLTAPELVELNDRLPKGSRVLAVGDAEMFEARFVVDYNTVFDHCLLEQWLADPATPPGGADRPWRPTAEMRAELARRGITHIYVNWLEILRYRSPGNYGYTAFVQPRRFDELRERGVIGAGWQIPAARLPLDRLDDGRRSIIETWGRRPVVRAGGEDQLVTFEVFPVLP